MARGTGGGTLRGSVGLFAAWLLLLVACLLFAVCLLLVCRLFAVSLLLACCLVAAWLLGICCFFRGEQNLGEGNAVFFIISHCFFPGEQILKGPHCFCIQDTQMI